MAEYQVKVGELTLETDQRRLARAMVELAQENKVEVEVTRNPKPKPVKFAGLGDE